MSTFKIRSCRFCRDGESKDNLLIEGNNVWFDLVEFCVGVKITFNDEPQSLCTKCSIILCSFVDFKNQCLKSHYYWKSLTSKNAVCLVQKCDGKSESIDSGNLYDQISNEESQNDFSDSENIYNDSIKTINENIQIPQILNNSKNDINSKKKTNVQKNEVKFETIDSNNLFNEILSGENKNDLLDIKNTYNESVAKKDENILISETNSKSDIKVEKETKCIDVSSGNKKKIPREKAGKVRNGPANKIEKKFKCMKCNECFGNYNTLLRHTYVKCHHTRAERQLYKEKKPPEVWFLCGLCDFKSHSVEEVNDHFKQHMHNNDLECKICNFIGTDFADMCGHRKRHKAFKSRVRLVCPSCSKRLGNKEKMEFHYRWYHLNQKIGICSICNLEFSTLKHFEAHMLGHRNNKLICDICGEMSINRHKMINHLKEHEAGNGKRFICHECGYQPKLFKTLKEHMETVHCKTGPVKCHHCGKYYKSPKMLKEHLKYIDKKNSLACDICGKCYACPYKLRFHRACHSNERPYSCDQCGSRFKTLQYRNHHLKIHTFIRPHKCDKCPKAFISSNSLKRHSRVHTGISFYKDKRYPKKKHLEQTNVNQLFDVIDKEILNSNPLINNKNYQ